MQRMRTPTIKMLVAGLLSAVACGALAVPAGATNWHVKVTNLTTGQPFSAPLWAVHTQKEHVWQVGHQATNGAALIAEDALAAPLLTLLQNDRAVSAAGLALPPVTDPPTAPPIPPGAVREFDISSHGKFGRLSMMWMLVRSNDAFSGLDSFHLEATARQHRHSHGSVRGKTAKTRTILVNAYDAGTEKNNEDGAYIPGPPFNHFFVRDQDAQLIAPHPGLRPDGGLAAYIWQDPVAQIEITKVP
jgi:hypothetical protein